MHVADKAMKVLAQRADVRGATGLLKMLREAGGMSERGCAHTAARCMNRQELCMSYGAILRGREANNQTAAIDRALANHAQNRRSVSSAVAARLRSI